MVAARITAVRPRARAHKNANAALKRDEVLATGPVHKYNTVEHFYIVAVFGVRTRFCIVVRRSFCCGREISLARKDGTITLRDATGRRV